MRWLLAPYAERRTYLILLYLVLGLPLGVFEFTLMVTGFSLGLGLLITLLGIPVLIGTLLVAHALATFERRLAWSLLDAPMPALPLRDEATGFFWARLRSLITSRRTWMEVAFLLLRLPTGILDFTIAVTIVSLMFGGFVQPILVAAGVESNFGSWTIDTFGESLIWLPISILFLLVGPRLLVGWGGVSAWFATAMLAVVEPAELKRRSATCWRGSVERMPSRSWISSSCVWVAVRSSRRPASRRRCWRWSPTGFVTSRRDGPRTTYALANTNP